MVALPLGAIVQRVQQDGIHQFPLLLGPLISSFFRHRGIDSRQMKFQAISKILIQAKFLKERKVLKIS